MVEDEFAEGFGEGLRVGGVGDAHRGVEDLEDAVGGGGALLDLHGDAADFLDGFVEGPEGTGEDDAFLERDAAEEGEEEDGDAADAPDDVVDGVGEGAGLGGAHHAAEELPALVGEAFLLAGLLPVCLDDHHAGEGFLHDAGQVGQPLLSLAGDAADAAADDVDGDGADGDEDEGEDGEAPFLVDDEAEHHQEDDGLADGVGDDVGDGVLEELGVGDGAGDHVAGSGVVEEGHGQALQVGEEADAQVHDDCTW